LSGSAAQDLAALNARLAIDGEAVPLLADRPKKPSVAVLFGAPGKSASIGALLGDLDARRERESMETPFGRCGGTGMSEEEHHRLAVPTC
jgi:hypothetical protein